MGTTHISLNNKTFLFTLKSVAQYKFTTKDMSKIAKVRYKIDNLVNQFYERESPLPMTDNAQNKTETDVKTT